MKRILSFFLSAIILLTFSVGVMAESEAFTFSLLANGKTAETVMLGETVDVTLVITKNDGADAFDLYSAQDYICFDDEYLEIVEIKGYTKDNIQIFSANSVKLMDKVDRVYTNRDSLTPVNVSLPLAAVKVTFKTIKPGITELSHDTPEMLENLTSYSIKQENVTIQIISPDAVKSFTFATNGGSSIASLTKNVGDVVDLSAYTTTRSGYTFEGWYLEPTFRTKVTSVTIDGDITVYAKWTEKESAPSGGGGGGGGTTVTRYTITFMTPDGVELDKAIHPENSKVTLSAYTFKKDGHKFEGWYSDKALTNKVTAVIVDKDITLYANWVVSTGEGAGTGAVYKPSVLTDEHYAYVIGRSGGMIEPEKDITRAEVVTIIYRLLNETVKQKHETSLNNFVDVNEGDWFNTAASTLANLGVVKGREADVFAPNAYITRAELATIFARMVDVEYDGRKLFSDVSGHWAESYINEAAVAKWVEGYNGVFRPDDNITRAEVMVLTNRVLGREPENLSDMLDNMITWSDNADINAWYYLAIQEATNSHTYEVKADGRHEKWTALYENPVW